MNFLERFSEFGFVQLLSVPLALAISFFIAWIFFLLVEKPTHDLAAKITCSVRALKP
jgi:peptidoglycan/LPS O-acetylase OafA/YrhL